MAGSGRGAARIGPVLGPAAAIVVVVAAFLPWTVSGTVARHSFATVRSARLLGIGDHPLAAAALGGWYFVPALAAAGCLAVVLRRDRLAGVVLGLVGAGAVAAAAAVLRSPVESGVGAGVALAGGAATLVGALALLIVPRTPDDR